MENSKQIKLELNAEAAPLTVENFLSLVKEGFYDGLIFHRVIPGFMIQGGDPLGNGMGGSEKKIKGEFAANGHPNPIRHTRGVISMARSMDKNSASSQFFIMHADAPHLDGQYAAFGKVVEGIETVDEIALIPTDFSDRPKIAMRMKRVYIEDSFSFHDKRAASNAFSHETALCFLYKFASLPFIGITAQRFLLLYRNILGIF